MAWLNWSVVKTRLNSGTLPPYCKIRTANKNRSRVNSEKLLFQFIATTPPPCTTTTTTNNNNNVFYLKRWVLMLIQLMRPCKKKTVFCQVWRTIPGNVLKKEVRSVNKCLCLSRAHLPKTDHEDISIYQEIKKSHKIDTLLNQLVRPVLDNSNTGLVACLSVSLFCFCLFFHVYLIYYNLRGYLQIYKTEKKP